MRLGYWLRPIGSCLLRYVAFQLLAVFTGQAPCGLCVNFFFCIFSLLVVCAEGVSCLCAFACVFCFVIFFLFVPWYEFVMKRGRFLLRGEHM